MENIIIAIDGYAGSGKGTIAKQLAETFKYKYIDTGAMYRAMALWVLENNILIKDLKNVQNIECDIEIVFDKQTKKNNVYLNNKNVEDKIRSQAVNEMVSRVASVECVRQKLVQMQQQMGVEKKIVMDGRDIGTNVFPHAEVKIFVIADLATRAQRRFLEMQKTNSEILYLNVLKNLEHRDFVDSTRSINPLKPAPDAVILDNTTLTMQEQFDQCLNIINQKHIN